MHTAIEYNCSQMFVISIVINLGKTLNYFPNVCKIDKYVHPNIEIFGRSHQFGCTDSQGWIYPRPVPSKQACFLDASPSLVPYLCKLPIGNKFQLGNHFKSPRLAQKRLTRSTAFLELFQISLQKSYSTNVKI